MRGFCLQSSGRETSRFAQPERAGRPFPHFRLFRCLQLFLFLMMVDALSVAQKMPKATNDQFPLVQINVSGSQRYSTQAIIASLGLRTGQQTTQKELEEASQRLANSGLFSLVQFRFGWAGNGVVANFDLADNTKLVPIEFENLVWFSPKELTTVIKQKLPLFTGVVPLSGEFNQQLRAVLQAAVQDKNLQGNVVALPQGPLGGEIKSMLYKVEGNEIKVVSSEYPGADHADRIALFELTKYLSGMGYEKSLVNTYVQSRLKDIYDMQGYLGAQFEEPVLKVVSVAPQRTEVALTTVVTEGRLYTFAGVQWNGNTGYSSDELAKVIKMKAGQTASVPKFRQDLDAVRRLYGRKGYLGVKLEFTPALATDGTAMFKVRLDEGSQYRAGKLEVRGLPPALIAKMSEDWEIKAGDVYDAGYPQIYMATKFGKFIPQPTRWEWHNREVIHDDTQTVDLYIEVEVKGK